VKAEQEKEKLDVYEERRGRFQDLMNAGQDFIASKITSADARHWGGKVTLGPAFDYGEGAGPIIGVARTALDYGFRQEPFSSRLRLAAMYGLRSGGFGVEASGDYYRENSTMSLHGQVRATQFEANRFYGLGNDTDLIGSDLALVMRDEALVRAGVRWHDGTTWFGIGPIARYTKNHPEDGSIADFAFNGGDFVEPVFSTSVGQVGGVAEFGMDRANAFRTSGWRLSAVASAYPAFWDLADAYVRAGADAAAYIPLGSQTLAFRAGATRIQGDFPLHDAAFLGGRSSLRGFRWNRFAGDTEVHGGAELRVPLLRMTLLTRGQLGAVTFYDAGRVWFDGESEGGWNTGTGFGLTFTTLNNTVSLMYANGEEARWYVQFGMPF
jgi:hypothetical protein